MIASLKIPLMLMLAVLTESFQLSMKSGGHGQGFKFLPLLRGSKTIHFPRIMQIAGVYPNLTPEDLLQPVSTPAASAGSWAYDFPDADQPQQGTVAIPGSSVVTSCIDPVVMITTNTVLGVQLNEEVEMLVVVDRGDRYFTPETFFVFRTPENELVVQWTDKVEAGFEVLGRVALCTVPYLKTSAAADTGFAENDGDED